MMPTNDYLELIVQNILEEYENAKKAREGEDVYVGWGCIAGLAKQQGRKPPPESCFTRRTVMKALKIVASKGYKIQYGPTEDQQWDMALINDVPVKFFFFRDRNPVKWIK